MSHTTGSRTSTIAPHSLVRVPWLKPVVAEFFDRTLMHSETATKVRRRD
jgi:hypothetical protein